MEKLTLHEIAERFKIGVKTLKRMQSAGFIYNVNPTDDRALKMKSFLRSRRPLSVEMLLVLLREPQLLDELGNYESQARSLLREIGDPSLGALGAKDYIQVMGAALSEPKNVNFLADWTQRVVPAEGCGYHWLAVRALWNCPQEKFAQTYTRISRAFMVVRSLPRMEPWLDSGSRPIRYVRPNSFDL